MATNYWLGIADAVAQVATVQITNFDAATTYIITIGGHTVSVVGNTDVNTTASDLQAALAASTDPYFSAVTWTVATDTVTGTASVAGVPFVATSSVNGGTGTIGAVTTTATSSGPNDWSTAANWSLGTVPVNNDDVIFENNIVNVSFGLDQSAVGLDSLTIKKTYTGKIGLNSRAFATSSDGDTVDTTEVEYRESYLEIDSDVLDIGEHFGPSSPTGSTRILINLGTVASTVTIHDTAQSPSETGLPAVRLLANNASTDIFVRRAPGGFGVAVDAPGETSTVGDISISSEATTSTKVRTGDGVTLSTWKQAAGDHVIEAAATITSIDIDGGTLQSEGDYTITTVNVTEGTFNCNNSPSAGNAITTLNLSGGQIDASKSDQARTWATVNANAGSTLIADGATLTITTLNEESGRYTLTVT